MEEWLISYTLDHIKLDKNNVKFVNAFGDSFIPCREFPIYSHDHTHLRLFHVHLLIKIAIESFIIIILIFNWCNRHLDTIVKARKRRNIVILAIEEICLNS